MFRSSREELIQVNNLPKTKQYSKCFFLCWTLKTKETEKIVLKLENKGKKYSGKKIA